MIKLHNTKLAIKELELTTANIPRLSLVSVWYIIAVASAIMGLLLIIDVDSDSNNKEKSSLIILSALIMLVFILNAILLSFYTKADTTRKRSASLSDSFSL